MTRSASSSGCARRLNPPTSHASRATHPLRSRTRARLLSCVAGRRVPRVSLALWHLLPSCSTSCSRLGSPVGRRSRELRVIVAVACHDQAIVTGQSQSTSHHVFSPGECAALRDSLADASRSRTLTQVEPAGLLGWPKSFVSKY